MRLQKRKRETFEILDEDGNELGQVQLNNGNEWIFFQEPFTPLSVVELVGIATIMDEMGKVQPVAKPQDPKPSSPPEELPYSEDDVVVPIPPEHTKSEMAKLPKITVEKKEEEKEDGSDST